MAERAIPCSRVRSPTCRRSRFPRTTDPIAMARARYQGGTFVVAFASWPGHIKEGSTVNEMIHTVDLYPTLVSTLLAASSARTNRSTAWTCGAPSAKANLPRARRSSTTPSRSARASGVATGSSSGARCCRSGSNSTTSQRILQRRRILLQDIRKRWWNCRSAPINWLPKPKNQILLQIEFKNIIERMYMSPALPGDLESVDAERQWRRNTFWIRVRTRKHIERRKRLP